jgi:hypothetical protein
MIFMYLIGFQSGRKDRVILVSAYVICPISFDWLYLDEQLVAIEYVQERPDET